MRFDVISIEAGEKWQITKEDELVGSVQRLATGYLVTIDKSISKVKRFRMIDALREALGDDAEIVVSQ
jgi:hypothetical protein